MNEAVEYLEQNLDNRIVAGRSYAENPGCYVREIFQVIPQPCDWELPETEEVFPDLNDCYNWSAGVDFIPLEGYDNSKRWERLKVLRRG